MGHTVSFALHTGSAMGLDSTFAPLMESADRFAAAARKCMEDMQTPGPAAVEAARTFGDFLRVETMNFFRFPWSANPSSGDVSGSAPPPRDGASVMRSIGCICCGLMHCATPP